MAETTLTKSDETKDEAHRKIQARIEEGQQLRARQIDSNSELDKACTDAKTWSERNEIYLFLLFDMSFVQSEYVPYSEYVTALERILSTEKISSPFIMEEKLKGHQKNLDASISSLEGILDSLELYDEPSEVTQHTSGNREVSDTPQSTFGDKVFIVHGRDDGAKETVARFVENLGMEATILHEQPSGGQTIIEKIERYSSDAGFAIVLITPDDIGALRDEADNEYNPRARQNVVFELGYFMGKLGRERVCPLFKGEVENPSDIDGIVYVTMDDAGAWRQRLCQEMEYVGLPVQNG